MLNRRQVAASIGAIALFGADTIRAQDKFPVKPIKIVFPAAPGGGVEALARHMGEKMAERLGQPVLVEHRPGANAQIGISYVAKSPPDGYTLGFGFVTNLALAPHTFKNLPYDPLKDLTPVALLATNYLALVARADAPFSGVEEMSRWATSSKPPSVGTTSVGGLPHLAFEQLARLSSMPFTVVSYNGNGLLLQDLIGSRLDVAMIDYTAASQFIEAGRLKLLGITSPSRDSRHPKLPTIGETVKGYEAVGWFGIVAPARTPAHIVATLNEAIVSAIAHPDVRQTLATSGLTAATGTPEDFANFLKREDQKFAALVKQIDFKPQ